MLSRSSGLLLPIFSLPSRFGIGDLGPGAFRFVDFLHAAGQRIWQILPLNPTEGAFGHSPYHSVSCFAFNPLLISPEASRGRRLGRPHGFEAAKPPAGGPGRLRGGRCLQAPPAGKSLSTIPTAHCPTPAMNAFAAENACWIDDYALFSALSARHVHIAWNRWPSKTRGRRLGGNASVCGKNFMTRLRNCKIEQYLFYRQWLNPSELLPGKMYPPLRRPPDLRPFPQRGCLGPSQLFKLDRFHRPRGVSGVPPDYFSADGQLWGHPVYNWESHRLTRFDWWIRRIAHQMAVFDAVRIDHFRGLVAYWEVAAGERTARTGRWVEVPSDDLFSELQRRFVSLPLVAEDLGHITADVRETMQRYGFPGMRVLMFGFSGDPALNPNAVHNIPEHCVVYTGTHDNNTARGWFEKEASDSEKHRLSLISGRPVAAREIASELIRLAMLSSARWSIIPVQDLLGLGAAARINTPGQARGNWVWRMTARQLDALPVKRLLEMTSTFGRA